MGTNRTWPSGLDKDLNLAANHGCYWHTDQLRNYSNVIRLIFEVIGYTSTL